MPVHREDLQTAIARGLDRGSRSPRPGRSAGGRSIPADERTVFGLYGSTELAVNTTPSAPAASAERSTVPAFPGSRTSWRIAMHPSADSVSMPTSRNGDTPTIPCGVTVDVSLPMTSSLTAWTSTPAWRARTASGSRSSTTNRDRRSAGCSNASPTPWAPSTRKQRSSSRKARFFRRTAAATFGFLMDVSTGPHRPRDRPRSMAPASVSLRRGAPTSRSRRARRTPRGRSRPGPRGSCGRPRRRRS